MFFAVGVQGANFETLAQISVREHRFGFTTLPVWTVPHDAHSCFDRNIGKIDEPLRFAEYPGEREESR